MWYNISGEATGEIWYWSLLGPWGGGSSRRVGSLYKSIDWYFDQGRPNNNIFPSFLQQPSMAVISAARTAKEGPAVQVSTCYFHGGSVGLLDNDPLIAPKLRVHSEQMGTWVLHFRCRASHAPNLIMKITVWVDRRTNFAVEPSAKMMLVTRRLHFQTFKMAERESEHIFIFWILFVQEGDIWTWSWNWTRKTRPMAKILFACYLPSVIYVHTHCFANESFRQRRLQHAETNRLIRDRYSVERTNSRIEFGGCEVRPNFSLYRLYVHTFHRFASNRNSLWWNKHWSFNFVRTTWNTGQRYSNSRFFDRKSKIMFHEIIVLWMSSYDAIITANTIWLYAPWSSWMGV